MTAPITDSVSVAISISDKTPSQAGFGVPLLVGAHTVFAEHVREYGDADSMLTDGFLTTDALYRAASALCLQDPRPPSFLVGRLATNLQAMVVTLTPAVLNRGIYSVSIDGVESIATPAVTYTPTVANSTVYSVTVAGTVYTFTSDSSATASEIVAGLTTLINVDTATHGITASGSTTLILTFSSNKTPAVSVTANLVAAANTATEICDALRTSIAASTVAATFTTSGTATLILTAPTAGVTPELEFSANLSAQNTTPAQTSGGFATDLQAIRDERDDWYCLLPVGYSKAQILSYAAAIEPLAKICVVESSDADIHSNSTTDAQSALKALNYKRTTVWFSRSPGKYLNVALAGLMLPKKVGSATWAYKTPVGVAVDSFTTSQRAFLRSKNCNFFETLAGVDVTFDGKMAGGRYIDTTVNADFLTARIGEALVAVYVANDKVAFTDAGIKALQGALDGVLKTAESDGILVPGSSSTTAPKRSQTTLQDRNARTLNGLSFRAELAGAIQKTVITGNVTN